jgi:uncharacterized membrane protein YdjX (TVP38/TMEM64 family)
MNLKLLNVKWVIGSFYLLLLIAGIIFLLTNYNISDFFSYEFIRLNKNIILEYRRENFLVLTILFFIFSIVWVLLLGFAMPLLIFSGFVFGKWWGILIVLTSTTIGAVLLYFLAGLFFRDIIQEKFAPKFSKLKKFFNKNELVYFMFFRFIGGGGTPYAVQNTLPILFNMSMKNYIIATFLGSMPSMFVMVAIGSGIETIIDQNEKLGFVNVIFSPEIYIPIVCFFILLIIGFVVKKLYFKD